MKERRNTSLLKRLAAVVLCICMITVTFGTAVFAEKGTTSTTDDIFFSMEDITSMVGDGKATYGTSFAPSSLTTYSDGMITSSAPGTVTITDTPSIKWERPVGGASSQINALFGQNITLDTMPGEISAEFKLNKDLFATPTDYTMVQGDYKYVAFGFKGLKSNGTNSDVGVFQFDSNGAVHINSTGGFAYQGDYGDFDSAAKGGDGDGFYEFRIAVNKVYGAPHSSLPEQYYWKVYVYSAEDGEDATNKGTTLYWINLISADAKNTVTALPSINGFYVGFSGNGNCRNNYSSKVELSKADITINRFKAESADNVIYYDGGSSNILFNSELPETVTGITMSDADGGTVPVTVMTDGNVATVTPSVTLVDGANYKINVTSDVRSAGGYVAAETSFDVTANSILFAPDFGAWAEKYNITAGEDISYTDITTYSGGSIGGYNNGGYWINADDSLTISSPIDKSGSDMATPIYFDRSVTYDSAKGDIELNLDWKAEPILDANGEYITTSTTAQRYLSILVPNGAHWQIAQMDSMGTKFGRAGGNTWYGSDRSPVASNGYFSVKMVISKEYAKLTALGESVETNGRELNDFHWAVRLYDKNNNNNLLGIQRYTNAEVPEILGIRAGSYQTGANTPLYEPVITLKNITAELKPFKIAKTPASSINFEDTSLNVEFNYDVDDTTLNAITFKDADGKDIVTNRSASGNIVTLTLDALTYGDTYTLDIASSLKSAGGYPVTTGSYTMLAEYVPENPVIYQEDWANWDVTDNTALTAVQYNANANHSVGVTSALSWYTEGDALAITRLWAASNNGDLSKFSFGKTFEWETAPYNVEFDFDLKKERTVQGVKDSSTGVITWTNSTETDANVGGGHRRFLISGSTGGTASETALFNLTSAKGNLCAGTGSSTLSATVVDNFYTLKVLISPAATENNWTVALYDRTTGTKLTTATLTADTLEGFILKIYEQSDSRTNSTTGVQDDYLRMVIKNAVAKIVEFKADAPASSQLTAFADTLDINFSYDVLPSSANANTITLTDSTGNNVVTSYDVSDSTVSLSYGDLTIGETYTLKIMYGLKSERGADVIPAAYTFTASENPPLFYQDFSTLEDQMLTADTLSTVNSQLSGIKTNTQIVDSRTYEIKDGHLVFNRSEVTADAVTNSNGSVASGYSEGFSMNFEAVTTGTIKAEVLIKKGDAPTAPDNGKGRRISLGGSEMGICDTGVDWGASAQYTVAPGCGNSYGGVIPTTTTTIDGVEYQNILMVASRASESDPWCILVYDNNNGTPKTLRSLSATSISSFSLLYYLDAATNNSFVANGDTYQSQISIRSAKVYMDKDEEAILTVKPTQGAKSLTISADGTSVTYSGAIYTRSGNDYAKVLIAAYDEDNELIGAQIVPAVGLYTTDAILTVEDGGIDSAKMFVFDNYDDITPLTDVVNATVATE